MSKKKKIIILSINGLLLILFCVMLLVWSWLSGLLLTQSAADRWRGESEERFAQISYFLPSDGLTDISGVMSFASTVDQKMVDASLEATENGELWTAAWSGSGTITVAGEKGSATTEALGVGGNYFLFHPFLLRSGSYIYEDDLMGDRVVLDVEMAWRLFGSDDVAGMQVTINGVPFYIAGVIERETDFASTETYSGEAGMFMSYETLRNLTGALISTYEIVMPDSISGYAYGIVNDSFPAQGGIIVENSNRYNLSNIWDLLRNFSQNTLRTSAVALPYWENAARIVESYTCVVLVVMIILLVFPAVCAGYLAVLGIKWIISKIPAIKEKIITGVEDFRDNRREKRQLEKEAAADKVAAVQTSAAPSALDDDFAADIESIIDDIRREEAHSGDRQD